MSNIYTKFGNDRSHFFAQDNNAIEALLKRIGVKYYFETCGPSALCNAAAAVSQNNKTRILHVAYPFQPEDFITIWLNDPRRGKELQKVRKLDTSKIPHNRVPQYLNYAGKNLLQLNCNFFFGKDVGFFKDMIIDNKSIIVCENRQHYLTIVGFNTTENYFIINDSWMRNPKNKNNGFNEKYNCDSFFKSIDSYYILVGA
jgi:hypothetical protein